MGPYTGNPAGVVSYRRTLGDTARHFHFAAQSRGGLPVDPIGAHIAFFQPGGGAGVVVVGSGNNAQFERIYAQFVLLGQTIAGLVSALAVLMAWTGVALSYRRLIQPIVRRRSLQKTA